ncbi:MAG: hypothetical protein ACOC80_14810 [Petrotogales bacterium]
MNKQDIIKILEKCENWYDASDIGNEIGIEVSKIDIEEARNLLSGIKHGISLVDGTHG